jgi:hypothetical protein
MPASTRQWDYDSSFDRQLASAVVRDRIPRSTMKVGQTGGYVARPRFGAMREGL